MINTLLALAIALFVLWIILVFTVSMPLWAVYLLWILIILSFFTWLAAIFRVGRWFGGRKRAL